MNLKNSPFTVKFLREAKTHYQEPGLFWGSLVLFSSCFLVTKDKWLLMKFGSSGSGKTISDKVAIGSFGRHLNSLCIAGRLTPAGMAKIMRQAEKNESKKEELERFRQSDLIFVEDLSRCTTHYLKLTALQFLAGLTKTTEFDDLTSDGGTLGGNLGSEPKKCIVAGTPSDWEEIASTSLYSEFIDRRSLTGIALMSPKEWEVREELARTEKTRKQDYQIILKWNDIIKGTRIEPYLGPLRFRNENYHRQLLYKKLSVFKRFPENVFGMIDSLAEGHARINGRNDILPEDYEAINKIFSRFLITADMKKKELFIVEELIRSGGYLTLDDLTYRLRKRSKREDLPELDVVRKTVYNYITSSKYLQKTRSSKGRPAVVSLSQELKDLFFDWNKEIRGLIQ